MACKRSWVRIPLAPFPLETAAVLAPVCAGFLQSIRRSTEDFNGPEVADDA